MNENNNDRPIAITPKGVIMLSLGGYSGDAKGLDTKANTDSVIKYLNDFITRNKLVIASDGEKLIFLKIDEEIVRMNKKWYQFWL